MRVIVNTECTFFPLTGVGHYTAELMRCLRARANPDVVDAYPSGLFFPIVRFWRRHVARYQARRLQPGKLAKLESLARRAYLGAARRVGNLFTDDPFGVTIRRGQYDLYHEPNFITQECDIPTVITVHDLSVLRHPEWHTAQRIAQYEREFARGLKQACHLIAVSEFTRREVVAMLGWPADRVSVTYNGYRPFLRPLAPSECAPVLRQLNLKPGFLLHVGTIEPRKNLAMLLKVYSSLPATLREQHPLVLVGGSGWNAGKLENTLAARGREWNVRRLGYCKESAMAALYSSARALVFPTLYEGFGMPTIEMMACGGAVLASTAEAVAETVGKKAHLIAPYDEDAWRNAILRVCTDEEWWKSLKTGAEDVAKSFTWERCADDTLTAYRRALGEVGSAKRAA